MRCGNLRESQTGSPLYHEIILQHLCLSHFYPTGVLRLDLACLEWPARVPAILSNCGARLVPQSGPDCVHSAVRLGHGDHVHAERGDPLAGSQRSGHRAGAGQHLVCGNNYVRRDRLQGAAANVAGERRQYKRAGRDEASKMFLINCGFICLVNLCLL